MKGGKIAQTVEGFKFDPSLKVKGLRLSCVIDREPFKRKLESLRKFLGNGHRVQLQLSFAPTSDEVNYRDPNDVNPVPRQHREFERQRKGNKPNGFRMMIELTRRILGEVRDLARLGPDLPSPESVEVHRITAFVNLWPGVTKRELTSEEEIADLLRKNMVYSKGGVMRQYTKRDRTFDAVRLGAVGGYIRGEGGMDEGKRRGQSKRDSMAAALFGSSGICDNTGRGDGGEHYE
ncbi:unnamed protein product [Amoebophrya sp. A25]|nr:unnamed protein product [Amoebophrya sp. A25]|eukprot:GSA25T00017892001.1